MSACTKAASATARAPSLASGCRSTRRRTAWNYLIASETNAAADIRHRSEGRDAPAKDRPLGRGQVRQRGRRRARAGSLGSGDNVPVVKGEANDESVPAPPRTGCAGCRCKPRAGTRDRCRPVWLEPRRPTRAVSRNRHHRATRAPQVRLLREAGMNPRRARVALTLTSLLLPPMAPSPVSAGAETATVVERQIDVNPGETNPCTGAI